jgi:hypothetical protein
MSLLPDDVVSDHRLLQILVRHLQFLTNDETLPDRQLWGATSANSEGCWFNSSVTQRRRPAGGRRASTDASTTKITIRSTPRTASSAMSILSPVPNWKGFAPDQSNDTSLPSNSACTWIVTTAHRPSGQRSAAAPSIRPSRQSTIRNLGPRALSLSIRLDTRVLVRAVARARLQSPACATEPYRCVSVPSRERSRLPTPRGVAAWRWSEHSAGYSRPWVAGW